MIHWPSVPPALSSALTLLADAPFPWAIAGGWALELLHGDVQRPHADVDIAVFREHQRALHAHLSGWDWTRVASGGLTSWTVAEWLAPPVHEVHAAPPSSGAALEFLLNEREGPDWVFRRDTRVRLPLARALLTAGANRLPVLAPEVVLLYKAKLPRAVDEADFAATLPHLGSDARAWLAEALDLCHPGHGWRTALKDPKTASATI